MNASSEILEQEVKGPCTRCGEMRQGEFYASRRFECKACNRGRVKARRDAGKTQAAERARYHRNPVYRAQVAANTARWRARNPEKLRAENILQSAVRRGRLIRQPCEVCGAKAHAHHADYSRPLDVQWLCPLHHARQHVAEGRLA